MRPTAEWLADTSVAVPLVMSSHTHHRVVTRQVGDRHVGLAWHAHLEAYAVLTRLPGDARLAATDAARLIDLRFGPPVCPPARTLRGLVSRLAAADISGGAAYDAVIAATAVEHDAVLLTRDTRAAATYARVGARHEYVG